MPHLGEILFRFSFTITWSILVHLAWPRAHFDCTKEGYKMICSEIHKTCRLPVPNPKDHIKIIHLNQHCCHYSWHARYTQSHHWHLWKVDSRSLINKTRWGNPVIAIYRRWPHYGWEVKHDQLVHHEALCCQCILRNHQWHTQGEWESLCIRNYGKNYGLRHLVRWHPSTRTVGVSNWNVKLPTAVVLDVRLWEVVMYMIRELEQSPKVHVTGGWAISLARPRLTLLFERRLVWWSAIIIW